MNAMALLPPQILLFLTASTGFHIIKGAENTLVQVNGATVIPATLAANADIVMKAAKALSDRVTIGATSVLVNLSNEWRAGGEVVVVLRNVQSAVPRSLDVRTAGEAPYRAYPVTVKSKRTGRLDLLDPVEIDHDGDSIDGVEPRLTPPWLTRRNLLSGLEISLETVLTIVLLI